MWSVCPSRRYWKIFHTPQQMETDGNRGWGSSILPLRRGLYKCASIWKSLSAWNPAAAGGLFPHRQRLLSESITRSTWESTSRQSHDKLLCFFILFELQAPWHHHAALRSKRKMIAWIFLVKTITFPLIISWHANQAAEWSPSSLPSSRATPEAVYWVIDQVQWVSIHPASLW